MSYNHLGVLVKMASLAFDRTASHLLSDFDLTPSQFKILKYLSLHQDQDTRQIDIENFFKMSNPTVTGVLNNLEKKGLIERLSHPQDKRSKLIVLNHQASLKASDYLQKSQDIEALFTKGLTPQQEDSLKELLLILINQTTDSTKSKER
ncbi:MarR family winged helix-turn-helix transcriptional regulator [Streptococcus ictaluri]|nr:MarR family transcriptional regulator [Streptococcus ictaluri]